MDWEIRSKITDLNNARVKYLTTRNKLLSIAILLLLLILLSFARPLLVVTIIAVYGLFFVWSVRKKKQFNELDLKDKRSNKKIKL